MIQRIFEGVHWEVGQDPMSLHSGNILPMDKVARCILKTPHTCTHVCITTHDGVVNAPIPRHIVTCIDLIRWVNMSTLRNGVASSVHVDNTIKSGTERSLVFEIV